MNTELKNDIVKIVIDKLLIGILILIAGLYGNSWLEKYKSTQSFNTDIKKIQVQKIGEVWEMLYTFESSTDEWVSQVLAIEMESADVETRNSRLIAEMSTQTRANSEYQKQLMKTATSNRFWLGERQYDSIIAYTNLLVEYMEAYANKDPAKLKSINEKRDRRRISIRSVRDHLLSE